MSQPTPSVARISELQQMIADYSKIIRTLQLADTGRSENDVEHSYGLALTSWFMARQIAPQLNMERILMYALAHDIVELHAGDTYIFDKAAVKTKVAREQAALQRIKHEWPDFPDLTDYAAGYAEKRDAEARFVYTVDKMLPPLLINLGEKGDYWNRQKITAAMHNTEKQNKMHYSPELDAYADALYDFMTNPDYFYKDKK